MEQYVYNLISTAIAVHELEPAYGDHTAFEGLVDITTYHKADCFALFNTQSLKCEQDHTFSIPWEPGQ